MVNKQDIKIKILDSALKEFLAHGKTGAKTKTIAERAGVNKALIHYYYSSKDKLFIECVRNILLRMEKTFHSTNVCDVQDYKEYLEALVESYSHFMESHDKHIIFLLWEHLNDTELLLQIKEIIGSAHLKEFILKTKRAMDSGVIKKIDPLDLYLNLISMVLSAYMLLPITLTFLEDKSKGEKNKIMEKRKSEITRMLWNDIKENL